MLMKHLLNDVLSVILTTFVYLVGGFDIAIQSLLIVIVIDYLTGIASAVYNKKLSSKTGFKGIIKKFCYLLVVALSVVIDNLLGQSGLIRTLVIYFFVANDGLSIIENMSEMNIKLPQKLIDALEQIKKKGE
jgi:toxin secretion/phage lysis holin